MEKKDFDFVPDSKWLTVGNRKFDISRVTAGRALRAMKVYNSLIESQKDSHLEAIDELLDACLLLFRIDFSWLCAWDWLKRMITGKRYILKHLDYNDLNDFVQEALEPILGPKKKEMEHREKLMEVERELLKKMSPEDLAGLLQNLLSSQAGLGKKFSDAQLKK